MEKIQIPLVSICCQTYNHVSYIRECLEGFLLQKTNFPVEILIHDDASTDGTADIIREYESKYPDLIFPIYQTENQYSQGVRIPPINYRRARGKYIAFCEGDDYWTEPMKLQWQVDFMEANPGVTLTCHRYDIFYEATRKYTSDGCDILFEQNGNRSIKLDQKQVLGRWITQPATMVFLKEAWDNSWLSRFKHPVDLHLIFSLVSKREGYCFNFKGAVYRIHEKGISLSVYPDRKKKLIYSIAKELYQVERTPLTKLYFWINYGIYYRMLLRQRRFREFFVTIGRDEFIFFISKLSKKFILLIYSKTINEKL